MFSSRIRLIRKISESLVANLLFKGSCSVLIKRGQVRLLLIGTQADGLCVTLDGVFIFAGLEVLVAFIFRCLGAVQRVLKERTFCRNPLNDKTFPCHIH